MSRIIFITGTDTGVGKTVLTTLLLLYLRNSGVKALAMKPFCSGGTEDLEAFRRIQGDELSSAMLNPIYFPEPLAPLVAARMRRKSIHFDTVMYSIRMAQNECECLLVEGAGGVLVPITEQLSMADLIAALKCEVLIVARNELGTLNHTFLTLEALGNRGIQLVKVILMEQSNPDLSSKTNLSIIGKTMKNIRVYSLPHLKGGKSFCTMQFARLKKIKKTLAQITRPDNFISVVRTAAKAAKRKTKKSLTVSVLVSKTQSTVRSNAESELK